MQNTLSLRDEDGCKLFVHSFEDGDVCFVPDSMVPVLLKAEQARNLRDWLLEHFPLEATKPSVRYEKRGTLLDGIVIEKITAGGGETREAIAKQLKPEHATQILAALQISQ